MASKAKLDSIVKYISEHGNAQQKAFITEQLAKASRETRLFRVNMKPARAIELAKEAGIIVKLANPNDNDRNVPELAQFLTKPAAPVA